MRKERLQKHFAKQADELMGGFHFIYRALATDDLLKIKKEKVPLYVRGSAYVASRQMKVLEFLL